MRNEDFLKNSLDKNKKLKEKNLYKFSKINSFIVISSSEDKAEIVVIEHIDEFDKTVINNFKDFIKNKSKIKKSLTKFSKDELEKFIWKYISKGSEIAKKQEFINKKFLIDRLSRLKDKNFNILDIEEIADFLLKFDRKTIEDTLKFLESLKKLAKHKVEIFFIDEDDLKGIYIDIIFDKNISFSDVDKEIDKFYNLLDEINKDLWFLNIGERFIE